MPGNYLAANSMKAILFFLILISYSCNQNLKSQTMDKNLIGTWTTDEDDEMTLQTLETQE